MFNFGCIFPAVVAFVSCVEVIKTLKQVQKTAPENALFDWEEMEQKLNTWNVISFMTYL